MGLPSRDSKRFVGLQIRLHTATCFFKDIMAKMLQYFHRLQSSAAPAVALTTVPVIMRARSDAIRTAAFAVS